MRTPLILAMASLGFLACHREQRALDSTGIGPPPAIKLGELAPGPGSPAKPQSTPHEANAFAISEGKRLFSWYNCVGCHSHGGGGMGPPLMDDFWIYGNAPENVYASIVEGRPNGMPSFRGRIPDDEVWRLVAYVRSLGGLQPTSAVAPRDDHMSNRTRQQVKP
jgi:cytochrome c oxidase cbb3-type subunit 3